MKNKLLLFGIISLALGLGLMVWGSHQRTQPHHHEVAHESIPISAAHPRVPAYQLTVNAKSLPQTLSPNEFFGKAREAYEAARAIPEVFAQLPCYCHCDQSLGHKSLHTCFENDHAAHCAVCVDEALLAYQLKKEQGMSPEQIRETIVAKYGG